MTLRTVLLVLVVSAACAGCSDSPPVAAPGASRFATAYRMSASPPLGDVGAGTAAALGDFARGRCPALPPVPTLLSSALNRVKAVRMVLCRYRGLNDSPPLSLYGAATVTHPPTVESWRRRFMALPRVDSSRYHCPNDDDSAVLAAFVGTNMLVVVRLSLQGCQFVTIGGDDTRSTAGSVSLRADLVRLVP